MRMGNSVDAVVEWPGRIAGGMEWLAWHEGIVAWQKEGTTKVITCDHRRG